MAFVNGALPCFVPPKGFWHHCVLLLFVLLPLTVLSFIAPGTYLAIAALAVFFVYTYVFYRYDTDFFVMYLFLLYTQFTAVLSNAYIESGGLILEQFQYGYATGSTMRLVCYDYIFFLTALIVYRALVPRDDGSNPSTSAIVTRGSRNIIYAITVSTFVFLALGLAVYGSPLLMQIDRFAYWESHSFPVLDSVRYKLNIIAVLLGIISVSLVREQRRALLPKLMLFLIFAFNVLFGDKFSGIIVLLALFFLPLGLELARRKVLRVSVRLVVATVLFVSLLVSIVTFHYQNIAKSKSVTALIVARAFGLQGHVWWGIDEEAYHRAVAGRDASSSFDSHVLLGTSEENSPAGMTSLMYEVSPVKLVNAYLKRGIRFTMADPAIGLFTLGYTGLVFLQVASAIVFSVFAAYFRRQIVQMNLVRCSICTLLLLGLYEAFIMGNISFLFTPYYLKYILMLLGVEIGMRLVPRRSADDPGPMAAAGGVR